MSKTKSLIVVALVKLAGDFGIGDHLESAYGVNGVLYRLRLVIPNESSRCVPRVGCLLFFCGHFVHSPVWGEERVKEVTFRRFQV